MNNNSTAREYLSLYRQHFNMMQSFYDLNNNIIIGINNTLMSNRPNRQEPERNFMQIPFTRPAIPQSPPRWLQGQHRPPPQPPLRWPPPPPPPPPPPSNISPNLSTPPGNFDTSRNSTSTNTTSTNINSTFFNSRIPRRPHSSRNTRMRHRRSLNQPFFFNTTFNTSDLQETLNNSLYDAYPQTPLPQENFNNETISNTWENIRNIFDLSNNQICPITRENFNDDTNVSIINHCSHIFTRNQLLNWFQFDTRCPICRYNLRNTSSETTPNTTNTQTNTQTNTTPTTPNTQTNTTPTTPNTQTNTTPTTPNTQRDMNYLNEEFSRISSILNNNEALNDISENIFNLSNEIATNVMNVFSDLSNSLNQDNSNNILTNELIFNIPNIFNNLQHNNSTFPETNYNNPYSNSTDYFNPFNATEQTILNPAFNVNNENNQNTNNTDNQENEENNIDEENPTTDSIFDDSELYNDEDNVD
jgi:hypothetical protein